MPSLLKYGNLPIAWVTPWTGEVPTRIDTTNKIGGRTVLRQSHKPGVGRPDFKSVHGIRAIRSATERLCQVCGEPFADGETFVVMAPRGKFGTVTVTDADTGASAELPSTGEPPMHRRCGKLAATVCPHLREALPTGRAAVREVWAYESRPTMMDFEPGTTLHSQYPEGVVKGVVLILWQSEPRSLDWLMEA